ncbi:MULTISPECIES: hypothetical protein [Streptomyces]|uniref:Uncharacterized protein n=1 Tax=Streptomyces evansiae TaxID=3075535 RepID=A0ABU2R504_9ACTN|nr:MULTISPECIES: hypothetical protein [unclassified Streptomyces]MDT0411776.1 hypothetical protein [Streptomyces sp. DSM 41979]SCE31078.1 hypothetical protein GA0115252_140912 [Streptomyces sp. DfronAA-171]
MGGPARRGAHGGRRGAAGGGPEGREDGGPAVEAAIEAALADRPDTRPLRALCALGDGPQTPKDGLV